MQPILLVTLGQRPEAITVALDNLQQAHTYQAIGIIHTHKDRSGIKDALRDLLVVLETDYPTLKVLTFEVTDTYGTRLIDIESQNDAQVYYQFVVRTLKFYRQKRIPMHLLIASGRKAMSVYATLAAGILFGADDAVLTVLSPQGAMAHGQFHAPDDYTDQIQIVEMPLQPSRILPRVLDSKGIEEHLTTKRDKQLEFSRSLTPTEKKITNYIEDDPKVSNQEIAFFMGRKKSTILNHLNNIYSKLGVYFDLDFIDPLDKRDALIDVLVGRL